MPDVPNGALRLPIPVTVQSKSDRISTFLKSIGHCILNVRSLVATGSTLRREPRFSFSPVTSGLGSFLDWPEARFITAFTGPSWGRFNAENAPGTYHESFRRQAQQRSKLSWYAP